MEKNIIILSKKAGSGKKLLNKEKIEEIFSKNNKLDSLTIITTKDKEDVYNLSKYYSEKYGENLKLFISGGDGSISEAIGGIVGTETKLGILPTGTANDFAKYLYKKNVDPYKLIESSFEAESKKMDLMAFGDSFAANIISLGLDSVVLRDALIGVEKNPSLGHLNYLKSVFKNLKNKKDYKISYEFVLENGEIVKDEANILIMAICNGAFYGSGFNPAPSASVFDGVLDLVIAYKMKLGRFLLEIVKYKFGKNKESQYFKRFRIKELSIKSLSEKIPANYDGELFYLDELNIKVLEKN